jgi:hypothetical protein
MLAAGIPAREKKALEGPTAEYPAHAADSYQDLRVRYLRAQEDPRIRPGSAAIVDGDER